MGRGGVTSRNAGDHNVIERLEVQEAAVNKLDNRKASGENGIRARRNVEEGRTSGCRMFGAYI
jgi:hypothetical protein